MTTLPTPATPLRLFYIDDSGAVETGYISYSWIEVTPDGWREGLQAWLELRKALYAEYQIPPSVELHATKLVSGRGEPSTNPGVNTSKAQRREIMELALGAIGSAPGLAVGTAFRRTETTRRAYAAERAALYENLINHLDTRLTATSEFGMVFMDGNGNDPSYQRAHRGLKLPHRRIIEDPLFQGSHLSQWVQMADLVAWSTYQSLLRHPAKKFTWAWYDTHLRRADINGGSLEL